MSSQNSNQRSKPISKSARKRAAKKLAKSKFTSTRNNDKVSLLNRGMSSVIAVPNAFGVRIPKSYFELRGSVQKLTDRGESIGSRVVGCDLYSYAVSSDGSHNYGFGAAGPTLVLTPAGISPRLKQYEELYQFYAFRKLKVYYTNDIGSSTAGSIAFGLFTNINATTVSSPTTQQEILELPYAQKTAVWQPAELFTYTHTGTMLWSTDYGNSSTALEYVQCALCAILNSSSLSAATFGSLFIEYVVDFYQPASPFTSDPSLLGQRLLRKNAANFVRRLIDELSNGLKLREQSLNNNNNKEPPEAKASWFSK